MGSRSLDKSKKFDISFLPRITFSFCQHSQFHVNLNLILGSSHLDTEIPEAVSTYWVKTPAHLQE
jgi:hypothetical protein